MYKLCIKYIEDEYILYINLCMCVHPHQIQSINKVLCAKFSSVIAYEIEASLKVYSRYYIKFVRNCVKDFTKTRM